MDYLSAERLNVRQRSPFGLNGVCRNCIWWHLDKWRSEKQLATDNDVWSDVRGECRRNAPTPSQSIVQDIGSLLGLVAWATEETANIRHEHHDYELGSIDIFEVHEWPSTKAYDWCGEFKGDRQAMSAADSAMFEDMHKREFPPDEKS